MSERKPSADAVSALLDALSPALARPAADDRDTPAPIDRQAGASNIHSDPPVKNFPTRTHIDHLWHRAMDEAIRMNEFYTRYRFYELVREEVLAEVQR